MAKQILLLGEFSTGKSAFINMLLGVSILPERVTSTDLPIVKISNGKPAGIWLREPNQKNPLALDTWNDIPKDWSKFEYAEITIPDHPLLAKDLVIWDTPGINSTNEHHKKHLDNFLSDHKKFSRIFFFLHGNITSTSIDFLNKNKKLWYKLSIIVNIKEIKAKSDCDIIVKDVKNFVINNLGNLPVELLYIGDVCEEFNELSENAKKNLTNYDLIKEWKRLKINLNTLVKKHSVIGQNIFNTIEDISTYDIEENVDYTLIGNSELQNRAILFDSDALLELGFRQLKEKKHSDAFQSFLEAEKMGNENCNLYLGKCYSYGIGTAANYKLAKVYFQKVKDLNKYIALYELGLISFYGDENIENEITAYNYFNESYSLGYFPASHFLGLCYAYGFGTHVDYSKAFELFSKSSGNNNEYSKLELSKLFFLGRGVSQDTNKAISLLKESAESNVPGALFMLGSLHIEGIHISKDESLGIKLLQKSANLNFSEAYYALGSYFFLNQSNSTNYRAFENLKKAVEFGVEGAKYELAICFIEGIGTPIDKSEGINLLLELSKKDYSDAQNFLGECYLKGIGCSKDYDKALFWFDKSAKANIPQAYYNLCKCSVNGYGTGVNYSLARQYLRKSAELGYQPAIEALKSNGYIPETLKKLQEYFFPQINNSVKLEQKQNSLKIDAAMINEFKQIILSDLKTIFWGGNGIFSFNNQLKAKNTIDKYLGNEFILSFYKRDESIDLYLIYGYDLINEIFSDTDISNLLKLNSYYQFNIIGNLSPLIRNLNLDIFDSFNKCMKKKAKGFFHITDHSKSIITGAVFFFIGLIILIIYQELDFFPVLLVLIGLLLFTTFIKKQYDEKMNFISYVKEYLNNLPSIMFNDASNELKSTLYNIVDHHFSIINNSANNGSDNIIEDYQRSGSQYTKPSNSCFIVTATFGSPYHEIVEDYRNFRDRTLLKYKIGRMFINYYYKVGPGLSKQIEKHPASKMVIAPILKIFIKIINNKISRLRCTA